MDQPTIAALTTQSTQSTTSIEQPATDEPTSKNHLFWLLLILLVFFTSIISFSRKKIAQSYQAFLNENFLRQLHRANQGKASLTYLLLYLLFTFNAGIFTFLVAKAYDVPLAPNFQTLLLMGLGVSLVFALKHLLLRIVSYIYPLKKELQLYSFTIMIFSIVLGIALLPINILAAFAPESLGKGIIWLGLGAILAIYLFRSLRGLAIGSRYLMLHKFHFLLYLCAVEILPVVVLVKIVLLSTQ